MFRPTGLGVIGDGMHRSGWTYVMSSLQPWMSQTAPVVLDDCIERTFFLEGGAYHTPWIAICHHPVKAPRRLIVSLEELGRLPNWRESLPHLKLAVVMAEHAAPKLSEMWGVPCLALRHPTEAADLKWTPQAFERNPAKKLVQIGAHLRNPDGIDQAPAPSWLEKARLDAADPWAANNRERWRQVFAHRPKLGAVTEIERLDAGGFDRLLADNVVFLELLAAMANNTIVECIARDTPIVVNRLPGPEYYLGRRYPLFYDDIGEVEALLTPERILEAHEYLRRMPKDWLSGEAFARELARGARAAAPECWPDA